MSAVQIVGATLLTLPFIAAFAVIVASAGWRVALALLAVIAVVCAFVLYGAHLLGGGAA